MVLIMTFWSALLLPVNSPVRRDDPGIPMFSAELNLTVICTLYLESMFTAQR